MSSSSSPVDSKGVFDARSRLVGHVVGSESSSRTSEPTSLLVEIDSEAAKIGGIDADSCWIPYEEIASIRRDSVQLGVSWSRLLEDEGRAEIRDPVESAPA